MVQLLREVDLAKRRSCEVSDTVEIVHAEGYVREVYFETGRLSHPLRAMASY